MNARADPEPTSAPPSASHDSAVAEAAQLALAGYRLDELRARVLELAAERTGARALALLDLGPPGGRGRLVAQVGLGGAPEFIADPLDLELLQAVPSAALATGGRRAGSIGRFLATRGLRVGLAASLRCYDVEQVLLAARPRGRFGAEAGLLLHSLAGVLASAELRNRLFEVAESRLRQQAAVAALGQAALAGSDLPELAQAACDVAAALLGAEMVCVMERGGDGLVIQAGVNLPPGDAVGRERSTDDTISARVIRTGEVLFIPDLAADPLFPRTGLFRLARAGSLMVVPIQSGRRPIGTLSVVSPLPGRYAEDDVSFARGLANVVALAAERARVQGQLRLSIEELRKSAEDRSRLFAHVVQAQEEERRRIADDIHDDSVQVMTAVALRLATLRRRLGSDHVDPLLVNLEHDVRQSITRLRHLMFVLRPPALEHHGIAAAMETFLAQSSEDAGLRYSLDDRLHQEPETETRIVVYRIAQEAVANTCKHAHATRIDVTLDETDGGVLVTIRDDGVGFDAHHPQLTPPGHLGLMVMRERAEQSGGWCAVESQPGFGTTVRYCVGSRLLRHPDPPSEQTVAVVQ